MFFIFSMICTKNVNLCERLPDAIPQRGGGNTEVL